MVPSDARCIGCRYLLEGLDAHRCPECGRPFDPNNAWSVWLPRGRRPRRVRKLVFPHPAADVGLTALGLTAVGGWVGADAVLNLGWLLWAGLGVVLTRHRFVGVADVTPAGRRSRRAAVGCMAVSVLCGTSWGSCPHSAWVIVGPVGVSRSPNGMCDNPGSPAGGYPVGHGLYLIAPGWFGRG